MLNHSTNLGGGRRTKTSICLTLVVLLGLAASRADSAKEIPVEGHPNLAAALAAQPGRMIFVPAGDHEISEALVFRSDGGGLFGPGRIIQKTPGAGIVHVIGARNVRLKDVVLTRSAGAMDSTKCAVEAEKCEGLVLEGLRVIDNRSARGALRLERCADVQVRHCSVENYMTLSIDDRTQSADWGYAFHCIDGSGIVASGCRGLLIEGNTVIERNLRPTQELKERHRLGQFAKRSPQKGSLMSQKVWDEGYVNNWHQGSAVVVTSPETAAYTRILNNHIENAAQGIDLHADYVTVSGNMVINSFMGMKAMHGSRHVLIANNQFSRNDLWAIGLMPGAASHSARPAAEQAPARPANVDGGSIIANNIITDFGYGDSHWIWNPERNTCAPLLFDHGQKADNPPVTDVVVSGNVVYDTGRDRILEEGVPRVEAPRYRYAVIIDQGPTGPKGLRFANNIFHPGTRGISNVELTP